jgi:hypothetical protein
MAHVGLSVTIKAGTLHRRILTISDRKSTDPKNKDDITIEVAPAEFYAGGYFGPPGQPTEEHHFTVHGAAYRGMGDNCINHTIRFKDGSIGNDRHYTRAIEQKRFAPLFFRTYPNLTDSHYDRNTKKSS